MVSGVQILRGVAETLLAEGVVRVSKGSILPVSVSPDFPSKLSPTNCKLPLMIAYKNHTEITLMAKLLSPQCGL